MAVFDITKNIVQPNGSYNPYERNGRRMRFDEICDWLSENIGEYYGPGDNGVMLIGSGWEIFEIHNNRPPDTNSTDDAVVTYHVDITDDAKSMLFALKWTK